jgi:hypothetical protein
VLEAFGGDGVTGRRCYDLPGITGVVMAKAWKQAQALAEARPEWIVLEGDAVTLLQAGAVAWLPFDLVDLDAHGSPLAAFEAYVTSERRWPETWACVATDGLVFALRRGTVPAHAQPLVRRYGRETLLHDYPAILPEVLGALVAPTGFTVDHFAMQRPQSRGQTYH